MFRVLGGAFAGGIFVNGPSETDRSSLELANSAISGNIGLSGGLYLKTSVDTLRDAPSAQSPTAAIT